jgi:hypothetical protein
VARGKVALDGRALGDGDGAAVTGEPGVRLVGGDAEVLLFDLG